MSDPSGNWPKWVIKLNDTITAFWGAFYGSLEWGMGLGLDASASVGGVNVEVSAVFAEKDSIVISDNQFDVTHTTEASAEISVFEVLSLGSTVVQEHSYFDENCTCNLFDNSLDKSLCPAHKDSISNDLTIGLSAGAYWGIGFGASFGFNISQFIDDIIEIYSK